MKPQASTIHVATMTPNAMVPPSDRETRSVAMPTEMLKQDLVEDLRRCYAQVTEEFRSHMHTQAAGVHGRPCMTWLR